MDKAISAFLDLLALALITVGVGAIFERGYKSLPAWLAILLGTLAFFASRFWDQIKPHLGPQLVESVGKMAADFRAWLGLVFILWLYLAVSSVIHGVQGALQTRADIRLLTEQMNKYVLPRHLSEKQQALIANYLNSFDSHEVSMKVARNDNEASDYSADLRTALQKAGWTIKNIDYVDSLQEGLSLRFLQTEEHARLGNDPRRPNPMMLLQQAFGQFGIQIDGTGGGSGVNQKTDELQLIVGPRHRN